jgi:L,D-transpeptidase YcbB
MSGRTAFQCFKTAVFSAGLVGLSAAFTASAQASDFSADLLRIKVASETNAVFDDADRAGARAFYSGRDYRTVWINDGKLSPRAEKLLEAFGRAGDWGLNAEEFRLAVLPNAMAAETVSASALDIEIELSTMALRYARFARGGRISEPRKQLSSYIDRMPQVVEPSEVLNRLAAAKDPGLELEEFQPKHDQFVKLQKLLVQIRNGATEQALMNVALRGPELKRGDTHADVAQLRKRLNIPAGEADAFVFDEAVSTALRNFQRTRGIRADGVLGRGTRKALFVAPASDQLPAIVANMEQWRWMPTDLGSTHLFVNIPSFSVDFIKNGVLDFSERVIVGERGTQTPLFSQEMQTVVIRPEWYLPDSIKIKKIISASNRGRSLEAAGYKIRRNGRTIDSSRINWSKANLSNLAIYQPSGDGNALGIVKFLFPNKHSVYMHDTPEKSLFNAKDRLFSHGCVRLRNPLTLAQKLIDHDRGEGLFEVTRLAKRGALNNEFPLQVGVPVHIAYFTVWVGDDGAPRFFRDYYGHQRRVTLALDNKWNSIERGRDHLAAVDTSSIRGLSLKRRGCSIAAASPCKHRAFASADVGRQDLRTVEVSAVLFR